MARGRPDPGGSDWAGGTTFVDGRETVVEASPERVFRATGRIGGRNGGYAAEPLWRLRGMLDRLAGGPGLSRGRRHPERVAHGDALDFWRVVRLAADRSMSLRAEMKLPGIALLDFEVRPLDGGRRSRLVQTARFMPRGLVYWLAVLPFPGIVFRGMLRGLRREAESPSAGSGR